MLLLPAILAFSQYGYQTEVESSNVSLYKGDSIQTHISLTPGKVIKEAEMSSCPGDKNYIGKIVPSGIVFFLWKDSAGLEHGLIVGFTDQAISKPWSNVNSSSVGLSSQSSWDGLTNSRSIASQSGHTSSCAKLCLDLVSAKYTDWYLPSIDELNILACNRFLINKALSSIGGATLMPNSASYWSSTELDDKNAICFNFLSGTAQGEDKSSACSVRAIRAF